MKQQCDGDGTSDAFARSWNRDAEDDEAGKRRRMASRKELRCRAADDDISVSAMVPM
jgi:hypothetical protein